MRNFLSYLLLIGLVSSCGIFPPKWVPALKEEGVKQPVKKAYHLYHKVWIYNSLIDTNAVYISTNDWVFSNRRGKVVQGETIAYDFIRFSNDGVAFFSRFNYEKPDKKQVNDLRNGQYCYYTTNGEILKLEFFNHDRGYFQYWYGKIKDDGIYFYKYKGRPWGTSSGKLDFIYRKEPAAITRSISFP